MEMNANVWSNLALDLVLSHILPHLSLFERLALRSVCRHWKTLLVSKSYVERSQITSPLNSSCIIIWSSLIKPQSLDVLKPGMHKIQVFFYEHFSDKWLPLRALMPTQLPHKVDPSSFVPIASAHGLVCFQNMRYGSRKRVKLSVCNPTLNQWVNLPPLISTERIYEFALPFSTCIHSSFVSLVPKGGPGFYLILAGLSKLWIFDSAMISWKEIICDNLFGSECYKYFRGVQVIGKVAYILTTECSRVNHRESIFLLKYDINEDHISRCATLKDKMWSDLHLRFHCQLLELNGHVIMMGYNKDSGLYLWMFHSSAMEWSFFKSIQGPSWDVDVYHDGHFNVIKDHNLIYFHQYTMQSHDAFDVEMNEWKRLADYEDFWGACDYEQVMLSFKYCDHNIVDAIPHKRKRNGRITTRAKQGKVSDCKISGND